uniref:Uncharacterized protein n=1 Tax=Panagrolaimus superbus TaxID=310955 RepID=A0A914YCL7_9BILA
MNPKVGAPLPPIPTNQHVITDFGFAAKTPKVVAPGTPDSSTFSVFPNIPRTRFNANEHIRLNKHVRSMVDEIEGHVNKIAANPKKCNADNFASLAVACKQMEFMVRCSFIDVKSEEAKELAEMIRRYDLEKKNYTFKINAF